MTFDPPLIPQTCAVLANDLCLDEWFKSAACHVDKTFSFSATTTLLVIVDPSKASLRLSRERSLLHPYAVKEYRGGARATLAKLDVIPADQAIWDETTQSLVEPKSRKKYMFVEAVTRCSHRPQRPQKGKPGTKRIESHSAKLEESGCVSQE